MPFYLVYGENETGIGMMKAPAVVIAAPDQATADTRAAARFDLVTHCQELPTLTCKTCKHWDQESPFAIPNPNPPTTRECGYPGQDFYTDVQVSDDTGLWVRVMTHESFGCAGHEPVKG